jgi:SNF2 family DNA or RNA helicase
MLVLHAAAHHDTLALWGEIPFVSRGRTRPPRHGATAEALREAFEAAGFPLRGAPRTVTARLPGAAGRPAPSTPLIGETLAGTELMPWKIETIVIDAAALVDVLAFVVGKRLIAPGVVVGADLAFFATAMRLAAALVVRGHVLPSLDERDGSWFARWSPAPMPAEREQIASLYRAIPPAALAFEEKGDARRAIDELLASIVDNLMRQAPSSQKRGTSLHDRWVSALSGANARLEGDRAELAALQKTIDEWRRVIHEQASADFRVAFRIEEPGEDEDQWTIRFLLQGVEDPSLIVPLEHIFEPQAAGPEAAAARKLFRRSRGVPKRFVLSSLAQAASLSSSVDTALRRSALDGIATDTDGAFRFLASDAAALESAGFGVFLPSWWTRKGAKARLSLRAHVRSPKFQSKSGLSLGELVDVQWRVALGGEQISLAELRALSDLKVPLVRLRGQWVQLTSDEIREALRFAKAKGEKHSLSDVLRMQLGAAAPEGATLEVSAVEAEGPAGAMLERLAGRHEWEELPEPPGFDGALRPYQARGFSWLDFLSTAGLGACLADDMGLGKTVQTLAMLQKQWPDDRAPVLLICPTSVTGNWVREAARFTPKLPVLLHHGADRRRGKAFLAKAKRSALVISSYSLLARDADLLRKVRWKGVILDEAQNVKNSETKQARAARSIEARFRVALTGTPVENNIGDLWSILDFLNPGYLGSAAKFREKFFIPIQTRRDPEAMEALRKLTAPFILRRLKTDRSIISDLPEKNEMKVYCTLTKEQASLYQAVAREAESAISGAEGISRKGLVLATIMKLKQVCNHPLQLLSDGSAIAGRSGKLARLHEMLGEAVESGDRALVFTQFAEMGGMLQTYLQEQFGLEVFFLHGGTPRARRDEMVERFQKESGGPQIFILSLKAGGTGLNLTRASHVFHFDRWWNPAVENQATDRAFRIGQTRSVQVHKFICGGTFEEKIDAMIEGKLELATRIVGSGEGWLTELSDRDLRELFALRADAVGE